MPIREYKCSNGECGFVLERINLTAKEDKRPKPKCPNCGNKMERIMSLGTFRGDFT